MKGKILNLLLIVSSLFGFLEWGQNKTMFLVELEAELLTKSIHDPRMLLHPFVLLPLIGQILLLFTLFQQKPNKFLTYSGIGGIGILLALLFLVGCLSLNWKILFSTIPFFAIGFYTVRFSIKQRSSE